MAVKVQRVRAMIDSVDSPTAPGFHTRVRIRDAYPRSKFCRTSTTRLTPERFLSICVTTRCLSAGT